jgi:hypothetical protein
MGAPIGNRNAAGPHKKGWYRSSGSKKYLKKARKGWYNRGKTHAHLQSISRANAFRKQMAKAEAHKRWLHKFYSKNT